MKLSIIIPAYNEVATIEAVINRIKKVPLSIEKEIIIVDDASTDGMRDVVKKLEGSNIIKLFHDKNEGKGAAIRTALKHLTGDIVLIQDADLEYHPDDYAELINPILNDKADVVFGSRFIGIHRCFLFTHYIGNKIVNFIANILYNTILTDFMTGYKVFKAEIIKDIPIKSNRFGIEAEITGIVFRREFKVYEVPISYSGRDYSLGKKIKWTDFFVTVWWLVCTRFRKIKDISCSMVAGISSASNYNEYVFDKIRPYLGKRILEIGEDKGNIARFLIKNREFLAVLYITKKSFFQNASNIPESSIFKVINHDIENDRPETLKQFSFDTIVCLNALEYFEEDKKVLENISRIMVNQNKLVLVLPAQINLFSEFDKKINHCHRYDKQYIEELLNGCGFSVERIGYFNFLGSIGWRINFKVFKRNTFPVFQLAIFNRFIGAIKKIDTIFPDKGLSLLVVAKKK